MMLTILDCMPLKVFELHIITDLNEMGIIILSLFESLFTPLFPPELFLCADLWWYH